MKPLTILWLALLVPLLAGAPAGHELFRARRVADLAGRVYQLGEARGTKMVVLVFLGPECPISQRYVPELNRIAAEQGTNGVEFYGVVSGHFADRAAAAVFQKEYAIRFPILLDDAGALSRWLHPTHVPEVFVLKPDGDVLYRGRIDDGYDAPGKPRAVVQHHELRDAIAAVRAGRTPDRVYARPVGCYFE